MNKNPISKLGHIFWGTMFAAGLISTIAGIVFMVSGPEMLVLTVLFGGTGVFLILASVGRLVGWEK